MNILKKFFESSNDLRDMLPRGAFGEGVIDEAESQEDWLHKERVWSMKITIGRKQYVAQWCVLQTAGWYPRGGDKVRFDRQPEGVDDKYLFASRVED